MEQQTHEVRTQLGGQELVLSTGRYAKQAGGAVMVQYGETVVLGTATMSNPPSPDIDFLPLLVDYEEKFYAAGKIKGSRFVKREGRPTDEAILTARLIDRSIRPLFPKGMINDVQVVLTVLSYDDENDPDIPAMVAASAALRISDIPWDGPLGSVRVGRVNDNFVINPTDEEREESTLDLLLSGTQNDIAMLEGEADQIPEDAMLDALEEGQKAIAKITPLIDELADKAGKEKAEPIMVSKNEDHLNRVKELARQVLDENLRAAKTKEEIGQAERDTVAYVMEQLSETELEEITEGEIREGVHEMHAELAREHILTQELRSDGRALDEIRDLDINAGVLPRTHGSGLFQRGDTQVLTTMTLGGPDDMLWLDTMETEHKKRYIHYYNFPAFSVGEVKPSRGPGRREIGHGALAERALVPVLPDKTEWPYMMLLVSEVLESHGSSSMASVCGSTLAMMDGGVPIKAPVAGIAMGLITDGEGNYKVMTDIAGMEDEKGDMDFKIAGSEDGITAMQMDIKVSGLTREILADALEQAKKARLSILDAMGQVISEPRSEMSPYAPRIHTMQIPVEKIGDLIGPRGKHVNEIIEETGVDINIEDDGQVTITTNDPVALEKASEWVHNLTREIEVGERFEGRVTRIMNFGAFVELIPNVEGLVHISKFREERIDSVEDVVKVGDVIPVVVTEIDEMGRINLSHKDAVKGKDTHERESREEWKDDTIGGDADTGRGGTSNKRSGKFSGPKPPGV